MPDDDHTVISTIHESRDIPDFPGYRITRDGVVWTCFKQSRGEGGSKIWFLGPEWRRKSTVLNAGYPQVHLCRGGVDHARFVHRLILETFVGPCPAGMEARHLDGNRLNATLENLKWGTRAENSADRVLHGRQMRGVGQHLSKLDDDKVREIRKLREQGMTIAAIGRKFGVSDVSISYVCNRRTWAHVE